MTTKPKPTEARERMLTIRVSHEEAERFEAVAEHFGLTVAGAIRLLMKREADKNASKTTKRRAVK